MSKITFVSLFVIILLAGILRVWHLDTNPPDLFSDELINITSAKSIVETGKDLYGNNILYFTDRVELRPPIYGYSAYLSTRLLGMSPFGIRFPAVLFGLLTIVFVYLLTKELTGSDTAALFACFFLAISPWHIHYSRVGWEPASMPPFLVGGIYFFMHGITSKKHIFLYIGVILLGLTNYTYQAGPLYSLLFLIGIIVFYYHFFINHKKLIASLTGLYIIFVIPYGIVALTNPQLLNRAHRIFTFSQGFNLQTIQTFFINYFSHYGLNFLFISGDPNFRHSPHTGELYWWLLPFILLGLIFVRKIIKQKNKVIFIYYWFLIFPLAAALTNDGVPHATRSLVGAPLFSIVAAIGVISIIKLLKQQYRKTMLVFLTVLILALSIISLSYFTRLYYHDYPILSAAWWEYGNKETFQQVRLLENNYERVCLGNVNYWNSIQLVDYYLPKTPLVVIDSLNDPRCAQVNTILVVPSDMPLSTVWTLRHNINYPNATAVYKIVTID